MRELYIFFPIKKFQTRSNGDVESSDQVKIKKENQKSLRNFFQKIMKHEKELKQVEFINISDVLKKFLQPTSAAFFSNIYFIGIKFAFLNKKNYGDYD